MRSLIPQLSSAIFLKVPYHASTCSLFWCKKMFCLIFFLHSVCRDEQNVNRVCYSIYSQLNFKINKIIFLNYWFILCFFGSVVKMLFINFYYIQTIFLSLWIGGGNTYKFRVKFVINSVFKWRKISDTSILLCVLTPTHKS